MADRQTEHWFKNYQSYWGGFLLLIVGQAVVTSYQMYKPTIEAFLILFGVYLVLNVIVSVIILLLTWPAKRNLHFSRYIKLLIAFSAVFFLSQGITSVITYFQR